MPLQHFSASNVQDPKSIKELKSASRLNPFGTGHQFQTSSISRKIRLDFSLPVADGRNSTKTASLAVVAVDHTSEASGCNGTSRWRKTRISLPSHEVHEENQRLSPAATNDVKYYFTGVFTLRIAAQFFGSIRIMVCAPTRTHHLVTHVIPANTIDPPSILGISNSAIRRQSLNRPLNCSAFSPLTQQSYHRPTTVAHRVLCRQVIMNIDRLSMKASLSIDRPVDLSLNCHYKNLAKKGYSGPGSERGDVRHKEQQRPRILI
ncbi:hypothetical protein B0H19DRAFT_1080997 [Mycena capillaripes]|nr:hypothetical protein B0H19DRAFT_1080997 [Mycena capillaripes]